MKSKLIILFSLCIFYSCRVLLVPEYSQALEKQITAGQKLNDQFYLDLQMMDQKDRTFESCKKKYVEIESEINSIMFQNKSRKKNDDMIAIVKTLKDKFVQYKTEHKTKTTLSDGEIKIYEEDIAALWLPLLVAEKALKKAKK